MATGKRYVYKVKEVMALLKATAKSTIEVCSYDAKRPEKSGKRLKLVNVVYSSNDGYRLCTVRLPNGEPVSFHPCLMEKYNGTTVTP